MQRHERVPDIGQILKAQLHPDVLPLVDASLRDLKLQSRALQPVLESFNDELLVLHQIFYRTKNQHRISLFWRRVTEIRRYAERVESLALLDLINSLRFSFFDQSQQQSAKLLKGSWTHLPEKPFVSFILKRISGSLVLLEKMTERLGYAYRSFSLAIQTGAFAQVLLTLSAISSRMAALVSALAEILSRSVETIQSLVDPNMNNGRRQQIQEDPQPDLHVDLPHEPAVGSRQVVVERITKVVHPPAANKPRRKKSKPRDEIDAIFG
ncbi:DUF4477 domain-containing protein [Mycena indigotica]|uniref:DUF4477 domain-containing protein n=1 Tax=Mycena indigotica TaxID=2126181 RepID=A0A8H6SAX4_9AGAR|nr:DUF4477 domain-containing protein [Mycena indigotica]KAF7294972.1 DUF4477 domain-containing protein [Mycena indigotica]